MIAAVFAIADPLKVVEAGLSQIPSRSRLYKDMRDMSQEIGLVFVLNRVDGRKGDGIANPGLSQRGLFK